MGVHPIFQDVLNQHAAAPVPANDGPRHIGDVLRPLVAAMSVGNGDLQPRTYWAEGGTIRTATGRTLTVADANRLIIGWLELSIDTMRGRAVHSPRDAADLVTQNMRCISQLLEAINEVEGTDPTPPAAVARAA